MVEQSLDAEGRASVAPSVHYQDDEVTIWRGDALALPLEDASVDLVCTSPPYFGLRSYQDGGEHYAGQIGSEATPAEFVDALIAATAEMVRVLKPSGSIWVNLGDKYSQRVAARHSSHQDGLYPDRPELAKDWKRDREAGLARMPRENITDPETGRYVPEKSLIGIPWRYALRCIDDLGLILRAEVIWSKPNGLPESVTDRVRRSHETWFHFTKAPRYFSAVDEVREEHAPESAARYASGFKPSKRTVGEDGMSTRGIFDGTPTAPNPLGKLPGSVWTIPTQPLRVPEHLGVDHFAAFPMEWPRRIIRGWSPSGICVECGEGRRPVTTAAPFDARTFAATQQNDDARSWHGGDPAKRSLGISAAERARTITGEACACPEPTAPTRPAVVLDPFGGTGTTALVARALGRHAIHVDLSADYCRLAEWRVNDEKQLAKAREVRKPKRKGQPETVGPTLADVIEGATSVEELRELWRLLGEHFDDELVALAGERFRVLKGAEGAA